jgi:hypothetical protein
MAKQVIEGMEADGYVRCPECSDRYRTVYHMGSACRQETRPVLYVVDDGLTP